MITLVMGFDHLLITLDKGFEQDLQDLLNGDPVVTVNNILDLSSYLGNGWSDLSDHLGMTGAPVIGYGVVLSEDGKEIAYERGFWFPKYEGECWLETLLEKGKVIFIEC